MKKIQIYIFLTVFALCNVGLCAQDYFISPDYINSFYSKDQSKLFLGNKEHNIVLDVETDEIDSLLPTARIHAYKYDTLYLIFEENGKKGIANWEGTILVKPIYRKIHRAERLGGFKAAKGGKVYAISTHNFKPVEIGTDIEKMSVRFVKDKIGINFIGKYEGALVMNTEGDTLFNYLGKSQAFLREDFPDFLTVTPFDYKPGFKIIDLNTGIEWVDFPDQTVKTFRAGDYLRMELKERNEHMYLSATGELLEAGTPILKESWNGWDVYENCNAEEKNFRILKKESKVILPCGNNTILFYNDPPMLSYWHRKKAYSFLDIEGNIIIDGSAHEYCKQVQRKNDFFLRSVDGNLFEILNAQGEILFELEGGGYSPYSSFKAYSYKNKNYFCCQKNREYFVFDESGKIIFSKPWAAYSMAPYLKDEFWVFQKTNEVCQVLNLEGELIHEFENIHTAYQKNNTTSPYLVFSKNKVWYLYDMKRNEVVLDGFASIEYLNDHLFLVKTADLKYGVVAVEK